MFLTVGLGGGGGGAEAEEGGGTVAIPSGRDLTVAGGRDQGEEEVRG